MRKGIRLAVGLLLLAFVAAMLVGCLEHRSPDEYGYAMIIGVDEGEEKAFYVSMLLQRGNGSAESNQGELPAMVGVECDDLFEAVDLLGAGLPFALSLSRVSAIVFSEDIAMGGEIKGLLSASLGTLFVRYYANLIVARGRADEYLSGLNSELAPNIAKLQYSFVEYSEATGYIPSITLAQFYDRAWSNAGDVLLPLGAMEQEAEEAEEESTFQLPFYGYMSLPVAPGDAVETADTEFPADLLGDSDFLPGGKSVRSGGLGAAMMGSAVFSGTEMVGILNGEHTQAVLMATGQFRHGRMQIALPDGRETSVLLSQEQAPTVTLRLGENPTASMRFQLHAAIEQPALMMKWTEGELEESVSSQIERMLREIFAVCRANEADVFGFGKAAMVQFTDTRQWEAYDWPAAYAELTASFAVDVQLIYNPTASRLE